MRITIQALIDGVEGSEPRAETIGVVERDADGAPASRRGLFLRETHAVLQQLQAVVLREQVAQFVERASHCRRCGGRLARERLKPRETMLPKFGIPSRTRRAALGP